MKKVYKNGFTLTELLLVVGIIAIISAIAIPTFINVAPKIMSNKYKADAMVLMQNIQLFFDGRLPGSEGNFFNPFSDEEEIFAGVEGRYCDKNGNEVDGINDDTYYFNVFPKIKVTENHWICGSYDPETDTWEQNDKCGCEYEYKGIKCNTPGEYFLRCIYEYGSDVPASQVKFPEYNNGSKLYITFEEKEPLNEEEKKCVDNNKNSSSFKDYVAKNNQSHPVGILSIRSSDPLLRKDGEDFIYYTYYVGWEPQEDEKIEQTEAQRQ